MSSALARRQTSRSNVRVHNRLILAALMLAALLTSCEVAAQELTPRAYWPLPKDANAFVLSYQRSSGDIVTDPSLPLTGVDSVIDFLQVSYQRTLSLFGRSANLQFVLPYSDGHTEGLVEGEFRTRDTAGIADARVRLSINLKGAPSMDGAAFQALRKNPRTIIGASLLVQAPTGEYEPDKLINIGTNRWALKTELGGFRRLGRWAVDGSAGVWVFADNDEYLGDQTRAQDPIGTLQANVSYTFEPRLWLGFGATWYTGGEVEIDGVAQRNRQSNSRVGLTLAVPLGQRQSLKLACSTGVTARFGGDLDTCGLTWQILWFRR